MSEHILDNEGINHGAVLSMRNDPECGFTREDLEANLTACTLTGNNMVGKCQGPLFGKVVWLSADGKTCAVQAQGVARFRMESAEVGYTVWCFGDGRVYRIFHCQRLVIAVDKAAGTCDVLL